MVDHPVLFHGLTVEPAHGRLIPSPSPVLIERTDDDFLATFLAELSGDPDGADRKHLATTVASPGKTAGSIKLFQPVHGTFYLAMFEVACDIFGYPRLDPKRIDSAGLVIRRLIPGNHTDSEGWMRLDGKVAGWVRLHGEREQQADPDPARRPAPLDAGHPEINRLLPHASPPNRYAEAVSLMFVAPPAVSAATGRTVIYGLVPLSSSETVEIERPGALVAYEPEDVDRMLPDHFKVNAPDVLHGIAGITVTHDYLAGLSVAAQERMKKYVMMLQQMAIEFNAFDDKDKALFSALNRVEVEYDGREKIKKKPLGVALKEAVAVLVHLEKTGKVVLPNAWPKTASREMDAIRKEMTASVHKRLASVRPRDGRFASRDARYQLQGFVRVKREDGCPPRILWSAPSQPFTIAEWYEHGKLPPVQVALPEVTKDNLKNFLPNVAFKVPRNLFNLIRDNKAEDFLKNAAKESNVPGFEWICGFNIPIITLCAFIMLSIIISLLNIVFWWIAFIKICIPIPRSWRN